MVETMNSPIINKDMLDAGSHVLLCEFGGPSEHPVVDFEAAAARVFLAMLTHTESTPVQDLLAPESQRGQIPYRSALRRVK